MESEGFDDDYIPPLSKKGLEAIMRAVRSNYRDNKPCDRIFGESFKRLMDSLE